MDYEEFRQEMNDRRGSFVEDATRAKEMNDVWSNLGKLWSRFDEKEKSMAERVLDEWLESDDVGMRSDAEYLIGEFKLKGTAPYLKRLADQLATVPVANAPVRWELEKIQGLLTEFSSETDRPG